MKHESKRIMIKELKQCLPPRLEPTNQPPPRNERGRKVSSKGKKERKKEGEMISKIKLTTTSTKAYAPRATSFSKPFAVTTLSVLTVGTFLSP
jgi:hypothetical protein